MSTDIELYEDNDIVITATCGGWGVRLHISEPFANGAFGKYGSDLLTLDKLDAMIAKLQTMREDFLTDEPEPD